MCDRCYKVRPITFFVKRALLFYFYSISYIMIFSQKRYFETSCVGFLINNNCYIKASHAADGIKSIHLQNQLKTPMSTKPMTT